MHNDMRYGRRGGVPLALCECPHMEFGATKQKYNHEIYFLKKILSPRIKSVNIFWDLPLSCTIAPFGPQFSQENLEIRYQTWRF